MFVRNLVLLICFFVVAVGSANAQPEARIRGVLTRIDHAEDDLKWLIELSPTVDLKKQWGKLKETVLDAFTQGMDLKQPIEVDIVFRNDELTYEWRVPVDLLEGNNGLLECIRSSGYKINPIVKGSFYEFFEKGKKPYFLRYDKKYAWISKVKESVPANPPLATQDMGGLLDLKKDIVLQLKNDPAGISARRATFTELRKQFESAIKIRRNEDKSGFELRKLASTQQLDEAELFVVESDSVTATWNTTTTAPNALGRGEISITALPETNLKKSIDEFAVKPSYFANVALHDNPLLAGKLNFAMSDLRIKRAKEFYKAVRPTLDSKIDARPSETDAQKKATKQATHKFFDMLEAGAELKAVDAFIDAYAAEPGRNLLICGIHVVNGKSADEILESLKGMKSGWMVKKLEDYAGVTIYELTVPAPRLESFKKFFANESVIYVGTSKDAVWGAAGTNVIKELKVAIDQTKSPLPEKPDPVFLNYRLQLAKIASLLDVIKLDVPLSDAPKAKDQDKADKDAKKKAEEDQKRIEKYSKLAEDSMKGCEAWIHGELRRTGDKIEGFVEINECALKYIGALIADGVKEFVQ